MPWGAAIGAAASIGSSAMSSGKGPSGSTQQSTQVSDPVIRDMMGRVQSAVNTNNRGQLGTAMPGLSAQSQSAIDRITQLAGAGSPNIAQANTFLSGLMGDPAHSSSVLGQSLMPWAQGDFSNSPGYRGMLRTASGDFLPGTMPTVANSNGNGVLVSGSGNPYADNIAQQAANAATGATNSSFGANGRFASGANQNALVSNVSDATSRILSPIYENERNRQLQAQGLLGQAQGSAASLLGQQQLQAAGMTPALRQAEYLDPSMLLNVGNLLDTRAWNEANSEYTGMKNAFGLLGGNGGQTTTTPYFTNPLVGALAGGAGGASLYKGLLGKDGIGQDGGFFGRLLGGGSSGSSYATDPYMFGGGSSMSGGGVWPA